jgi:hypothetical protein
MPETLKQVMGVIMASPNGRDDWLPVRYEDVPDFVKHPDCMARLVEGDMVMGPKLGPKGSAWFRLETIRGEQDPVH